MCLELLVLSMCLSNVLNGINMDSKTLALFSSLGAHSAKLHRLEPCLVNGAENACRSEVML